MTENVCYSNTLRSLMAKLSQENSALLAVVAEQEKELSLLREAVGHCYGIVTETAAPSEVEKVAKPVLTLAALKSLLFGGLWDGNTSLIQNNYLVQSDNSLPPNCT